MYRALGERQEASQIQGGVTLPAARAFIPSPAYSQGRAREGAFSRSVTPIQRMCSIQQEQENVLLLMSCGIPGKTASIVRPVGYYRTRCPRDLAGRSWPSTRKHPTGFDLRHYHRRKNRLINLR